MSDVKETFFNRGVFHDATSDGWLHEDSAVALANAKLAPLLTELSTLKSECERMREMVKVMQLALDSVDQFYCRQCTNAIRIALAKVAEIRGKG